MKPIDRRTFLTSSAAAALVTLIAVPGGKDGERA